MDVRDLPIIAHLLPHHRFVSRRRDVPASHLAFDFVLPRDERNVCARCDTHIDKLGLHVFKPYSNPMLSGFRWLSKTSAKPTLRRLWS
jgi:hypothetical protein